MFCKICCPKSVGHCYGNLRICEKIKKCLCKVICPCCKHQPGGGKGKGKGKGGGGGGKGKGGRGGTPVRGQSPRDEEKGKGKDDNVDRGPCIVGADLAVQYGDLVCVVGKVGSGKTSLLLSMMGEIDRLAGSVTVSGSLSYASQSACVLNATVRENILYGLPYDEKRYQDVVAACALVEDIENLSAGDMTQIGEKGISLSGGQKQRVGLVSHGLQLHSLWVLPTAAAS